MTGSLPEKDQSVCWKMDFRDQAWEQGDQQGDVTVTQVSSEGELG